MAPDKGRMRRGRYYRLTGMRRSMWSVPHPTYGRPDSLVGVYLGRLRGTRLWHGFEVRVGGREKGCIFMTQSDLDKLGVEDMGPFRKRGGGPKDVDNA